MAGFVFVPVAEEKRRPSDFPRVTPDEQAARDADAERIVASEFDLEMPEQNRAALEAEYQQRFKKPAPGSAWTFVPEGERQAAPGGWSFVPEPEQPSILRNVALNNPLTAVAETGLNLATQGVALPVAGLAGLATEAGRAMGLTEKRGADVVHAVSEKLTYQPRGELGQATTAAAMFPFEKIAEAGQAAGNRVLDATGSPMAATAVDTAINALPMAIGPAKKAATAVRERLAGERTVGERAAQPEARVAPVEEPQWGFVPLEAERAVAEVTKDPAKRPTVTDGLAELPQFEEKAGDALRIEAVTGDGAESKPAILDMQRPAEAVAETMTRPEDALRVSEDRPPLASVADAGAELVAPDFPPEHAARLTAIDSRIARITDEAPTRTPAVRASLEREAQRLNTERQELPGRFSENHPAISGLPSAAKEFSLIESAGRHPAETLAAAGLDHRRISPAAADALDFLHENLANPERIQDFQKEVARAMAEPETLDMAAPRNSFAPGNAYTGFINDAPNGTGTAAPVTTAGRGKPIRREDILVPFAKALGTSIYEGRVQGKNRLGFFRPKVQEVRIKRHADLETAAHELAHLIDERVPAIANVWRSDKALREELRSISYDSSKVYEGYAEGVRLWMTQPEALQAKAPKVYAWLEKFADTHDYGPAMRKAQAGMTEWFGQDAIDRARSKIGEHRPMSDALDGLWDKFRQSVIDDLHGIYRMERELEGGKLAPVGAYESARLSRASASIADGAVRWGYPVKKPDGSFTYKGRGLEEILKPVSENLEDALLYFVGRSSRELFGQGREHLFTQGEIDAMLRLRTPEREAAFRAYQEWNKGILDFAEAQGVINPEARRLWQRTQYLPFHRVGQPGGFKGKPGEWAGVQALTGGTENIRDVLGNMVGNAFMLIDKAVKNEARLKVAELASREGGGKFMAKIDTESRPVKVTGDQVLEAMFDRYGIAMDGDAPTFFEFLIHGQPPAGGNVVAVLKGGKPIWYEVADPILYRSLQAMDRPPMHWLVNWLGLPKRVGQATITLTPDFMAANIARDTIMASVMSRSGFRPVIDSLQGMRLRLTDDPLYREYIANGGGLSSIYLDEGKLRHKLERFYSSQGIDVRTVLDTPDKMLSFIETVGDAFETSSRLSEFNNAIARGDHPRHAAYLGREVSTDFAMRGDSKALGFMYDTVMFLRPAVVSMDRLFRGVAHDPNKAAIGAKTATLALASVGLYLLNRDNPVFRDMDDWKRDAYWHFFVPTPDGGQQHFMWPKIWEIGAVASLAERTTEKLLQDDPDGLGKDFARIVGHTFNLNLMPQILAPLYEQATNRSNFTKAPIETPGMENVQPFMRAKPTTSETVRAIGMASRDLPESMQVNPVRAEALLRGYLNTWGMYGLMLSDRAFFGDKLPETRTDQLPVVRRFYSQEPAQHTKFETQFYEMLGEAKRLQGTLKELDRIGRSDIADEKEKSPLAGEAKPMERAAKNLQHINAEMRQVRRDDALSPAEKRQRLDELTVERSQLLKAAVLDAKAAQKDRQ